MLKLVYNVDAVPPPKPGDPSGPEEKPDKPGEQKPPSDPPLEVPGNPQTPPPIPEKSRQENG